MKHLLIILLLAFGFQSRQVCAQDFSNRREAADSVFGLLNAQTYGGALFDRAFTEDSILNRQMVGDYSGVSTGWNWLQAYSDIALSYVDPTYMMSDSLLYTTYENYMLEGEDTTTTDRLILPFGLLIHHISRIDTTITQTPEVYENQQGQLKLAVGYNEANFYTPITLKSAAILELDGEHGYEKGTLVYDSAFISSSSDVEITTIFLDVGAGFQPFSAQNPVITYPIIGDWQVGKAAVSYTLNGAIYYDTLQFYTSTKTYKYHNREKTSRWDVDKIDYPSNGDLDLQYAIKYGCGNGSAIRRPVIFAPPYRPSSQIVSFNKYYDQFDFKSLLSSLSNMGYDVIFIKEKPGNRGVDHAGGILAGFLKHINGLKKANYPNEDWENVVIGFSAGGQHWRYALKQLEYEHMTSGAPHHHTRLYIPFDSPHWGANVPMFAQAVFKDLSDYMVSIMAYFTYQSLKDAASKDMLMNHILGSTTISSGHDRYIIPAPTAEREMVNYKLFNLFNHQFTPLDDLRRSFPTFSRNVAVSVGSNTGDYTSGYGLHPGDLLYKQNIFVPSWFGFKRYERQLFASQYGPANSIFDRRDLNFFLGIPIPFERHYKTIFAYEWDIAQSSYKDEFYDKGAFSWDFLPFSGIPVGAVTILAASGQSALLPLGSNWGNQYYNGHMPFMPMVSALGINPSIWQNNNLYYNLKDQGLMYNIFDYNPNTDKSDLFGYPNLGHPTDHFNITPFEALYCDPQTYEHIKMQASIDENNNMDDTYLVYTRDFILDEVEANDVYLQNKVIGKNHVQWNPNYRYKAWYKAYHDIVVGSHVTPKTDAGAYVIEKTGEITLLACHEIHLKPGFSAEAGSVFHAVPTNDPIICEFCVRPANSSGMITNPTENTIQSGPSDFQYVAIEQPQQATQNQPNLLIYPNPTSQGVTIVFPKKSGSYQLYDSNGRLFQAGGVDDTNQKMYLRLPKGIYFIHWKDESQVLTEKIMVL